MKDRDTLDARAWLVWVLAGAALAMTIRNPLYTVILLLVARVVDLACGRPDAGLRLPLGRITLVVLLFATLFNGLFVHSGQTVLFRLPPAWPLVGGPITLEGMVYGLETGLILLALLFLFVTFNRVVSPGELVRLTPRAFHDLGVVVLIAITYVPETARHLERIREAQAIRGHRLRGLRDWRPVIIPLLVGGLERAMGVAEAMVARGYGATAGRDQDPRVLAGLVLGLLLLLSGWLLSFWQGPLGWLLLGSGALLLGLLLWRNGRRVIHTRYRPRPWTLQDTLVLLSSLVPLLLVFIPWPFLARDTLAYTPYPLIHLPPFDPVVGIAFLLFTLPAFLSNPATRLHIEGTLYD